MERYQIIKLVKFQKPFSSKSIIKEVEVYPYDMKHLGHAKACARVVNASIKYNDKTNNVVNIIIKDINNNVVFVARQNIDGIIGNNLLDEISN